MDVLLSVFASNIGLDWNLKVHIFMYSENFLLTLYRSKQSTRIVFRGNRCPPTICAIDICNDKIWLHTIAIYETCQMVTLTLKIRSQSLKSNQFLRPSFIYKVRTKFEFNPLVQVIGHREAFLPKM